MSRLLSRVASLLGDAPSVTVVVPDDRDLSALEAPGRHLWAQRPRGRAVALHDDLTGLGHADAVVDLARGPGAVERLGVLAAHVRRGGLLVVAVPGRPDARDPLLELVAELQALRAGDLEPPSRRRDPRPYPLRDLHALAATLEVLELDDVLLVARVAVETWSVLPEARADDVLAATPGLGHVVTSRPAERRTTSARMRSSWAEEAPLPAHDAPHLSLRSYDDVVVTPRMIAHARDVVLPQAFRNTEHKRPRTPPLTDWTRWSVRVPHELGVGGPPPTRLPGTWFHADNLMRGHFGHAITEQVSQLWAWPEVLARHPDAGVLVAAATKPVATWELDLLEAAGVPRERVHAAPGPVRVDRLLAATPGYVILRHVHPSLRELYAATGEALEQRSGLESTPRRIFVTRPGDKRRCHEAADVEALFEAHGFTVVAPEAHPLPDQAAMARNAEAVAGYGGSGMFHLLLGGTPRPVVVVSHTGYHVWNEKAIAALWDDPITVVRGVPDLVTEGFSERAMHSDYHLDLDGPAGRLLREALAEL
ncbi:MAG: hypothetical protein JWN84_4612 [Nocardioides sp.]|nr:hypothetical protein [Nocardioides sp.]